MAIIEVLVSAVAVIAAGIALVFIALITGIHQEERRKTFARDVPPTSLTRLTRRILGAHVCLGADGAWANAVASEASSQQLFALTGLAATDFQVADAELAGQAGKGSLLAGYR